MPTNAAAYAELTRLEFYHKLVERLRLERHSFVPSWRELSEFVSPRTSRFVTDDINRGDTRSQKIIRTRASIAWRTLMSGMHAGITSPARPWMRLTVADPDLAEFGPVKNWLHVVTQRMLAVFARSNLYKSLPTLYGSLGLYGTGATAILSDAETTIRTLPFPIGSYMLATDGYQRVDTFAREFKMTVRQLIKRFGLDEDGRTVHWDRFSPTIKNLWELGNTEEWIDVTHVITPNEYFDPDRYEAKYKAYASCYFETGAPKADDRMLEQSGYEEFPILTPRWETTGEDTYGTSCPGMLAIGDVKQLQHGEKRSLQLLDKMVSPPMVAPIEMKAAGGSILPGAMNYTASARAGTDGFRPAYQVTPAFQELEMKQIGVEARINEAFFADLFLMLTYQDSRRGMQPPTAREIDERHEEKLLALGPVLENLNDEALDPLVDRTFREMARQGQIPRPPDELADSPLKVDYISWMAQAQRQIGYAGVERFLFTVNEMAKLDPTVLDKVDRDQAVDEMGTMLGVPPRLIVPDEDVVAVRQARAKAQQTAAAVEQANQAASAVKTLADADTTQPSALTDLSLMGGGGGNFGGTGLLQ